jgi:hypothetical protein
MHSSLACVLMYVCMRVYVMCVCVCVCVCRKDSQKCQADRLVTNIANGEWTEEIVRMRKEAKSQGKNGKHTPMRKELLDRVEICMKP